MPLTIPSQFPQTLDCRLQQRLEWFTGHAWNGVLVERDPEESSKGVCLLSDRPNELWMMPITIGSSQGSQGMKTGDHERIPFQVRPTD